MTRILAAVALATVPCVVLGAPPVSQPIDVNVVSLPAQEPFQEFKIVTNCDQQQFCNLAFDQVPANKRLVVTHIGAWVDVVGTTHPYCQFYVTTLTPTAYLLFQKGPVQVSGQRMIADQPILRFFEAGEVPALNCNVVGTGDTFRGGMAASISGYFVDAP